LPDEKIPPKVVGRNRPAPTCANICCKMFVGSNRMGFGPNVGSDCPHIFLHLVKNSDGVTVVTFSMKRLVQEEFSEQQTDNSRTNGGHYDANY